MTLKPSRGRESVIQVFISETFGDSPRKTLSICLSPLLMMSRKLRCYRDRLSSLKLVFSMSGPERVFCYIPLEFRFPSRLPPSTFFALPLSDRVGVDIFNTLKGLRYLPALGRALSCSSAGTDGSDGYAGTTQQSVASARYGRRVLYQGLY